MPRSGLRVKGATDKPEPQTGDGPLLAVAYNCRPKDKAIRHIRQCAERAAEAKLKCVDGKTDAGQ